MKTPLTIGKWFFIAVCGIALFFILTKDWYCKPKIPVTVHQVEIDNLKRTQDSMYQAGIKKDEAARADSMELRFQIDSLRSDLFNARQALRITQNGTSRLRDKLEAARAGKDTAGYQAACDSLANEVTGLNELVNMEMTRNDSLQVMYQLLERKTASRLAEERKLKEKFRADFLRLDTVSNEARSILQNQLDKAEIKAARTFSLGIGIGYGIGPDGRLGPQINVNVSKTLIRFKL